IVDDEMRKHVVRGPAFLAGLFSPGLDDFRMPIIERGQLHADKQEERELCEHHKAAGNDRPSRIALAASAQIALHHHVIGPVRADREHGPANEACPERVWIGHRRAKIKDLKFAVLSSKPKYFRPTFRNLSGEHHDSGQSADDIYDKLNAIVPDD